MMTHVKDMFETHPGEPLLDPLALAALARSSAECAQVCTICADACLNEEQLEMLRRCIRLNLDCADVCDATSRLVARLGSPAASLLRAQIAACRAACKACGDECAQHAERHEHCRICMERCRRCEDDCAEILSMIGSTIGS